MTEYKKKAEQDKPKRSVGRPPLEFPEPIDDTPENIARMIMMGKPKKKHEWRYWQEHLVKRKKEDGET